MRPFFLDLLKVNSLAITHENGKTTASFNGKTDV